MSERYNWDSNGILDYKSDDYIESFIDIIKLLNQQDAEIKKYGVLGIEIKLI